MTMPNTKLEQPRKTNACSVVDDTTKRLHDKLLLVMGDLLVEAHDILMPFEADVGNVDSACGRLVNISKDARCIFKELMERMD